MHSFNALNSHPTLNKRLVLFKILYYILELNVFESWPKLGTLQVLVAEVFIIFLYKVIKLHLICIFFSFKLYVYCNHMGKVTTFTYYESFIFFYFFIFLNRISFFNWIVTFSESCTPSIQDNIHANQKVKLMLVSLQCGEKIRI